MSKAILQPFEDYQKARSTFVQSVADLATRPQNIIALHSAGVMALLRPLLLDSVQVIQQSAALAIGRLANYSEEIAESVVQNDIITQLIYSLTNQNRFYKKAACYVLRAVAKHWPQLADDVVKSGALEPLVKNLEEFHSSVQESAAWAIGYIAKHNQQLATQVVEANALPSLILCLQESEITLKRSAALTLSYIAQHSEALALPIAEHGLETIIFYLNYNDTQLRRHISMLLGNIAKHSINLANLVMNKLTNPEKILANLFDTDITVKKNAAFCICEIVNKSPENAQYIVDKGGLRILVNFIEKNKGDPRLFGIIALGYISAHENNEKLAQMIIDENGLPFLRDALQNETSLQIKAAACYTLGNIGKHARKHANKVAEDNILSLMLYYYMAPNNESSDDLRMKAKKAMQKIIAFCDDLQHLEPLIQVAPEKILKHILAKYEKVFRDSASKEYKKKFVEGGGLRKLQEIKANCSEDLKKTIESINGSFDPELIKIYSPEFIAETLAKIDNYHIPD